MILFDENILLIRLESLPFKVNGIGILKDFNGKKLVAIKEGNEYRAIGLSNSTNGGYLRYSGNIPLTQNGRVDISTYLYEGNAEIVLVIGVKGYDMKNLLESILFKLSMSDLIVKSITENKDLILAEENMENNTLDLLKIVFNYKFDYSTNCQDVTDLCVC